MKTKNEKNREKIIEAARSVVSKLGIAKTTLQAIADASGISKGSLYYYYKSKDDILYDIMDRDNIESLKAAQRISEGPFNRDELIRDIFAGIIERILNEKKNRITVHLQGEALQGNRELQKKFRAKYKDWSCNVEKVITALYDIPSGPFTRTYTSLFLAAVEGLCIQKMLLGDIIADWDMLDHLGELLMSKNLDSFSHKKKSRR